MSFFFNPHNLPGMRYFITQYIASLIRSRDRAVSNIYMLNIFADIKQSRQALAIPHATMNSITNELIASMVKIIIRMKLFMTATKCTIKATTYNIPRINSNVALLLSSVVISLL